LSTGFYSRELSRWKGEAGCTESVEAEDTKLAMKASKLQSAGKYLTSKAARPAKIVSTIAFKIHGCRPLRII
jgi:hypothetical protein